MEYLAFLNNFGMQEMVVIFVIALIIFGPKNLPKLGRALGTTMREFKDASNRMADSINRLDEPDDRERRQARQPEPASPEPEEAPRPAEKVSSKTES